MHTTRLQRAVRTVAQRDSGEPALARLAEDGPTTTRLSSEFTQAARSLAGRSNQSRGRRGILNEGTHAWA